MDKVIAVWRLETTNNTNKLVGKKVPYDRQIRQISYGEWAHMLSQVKRLEEKGIPFNHAEAITSALTLVLDNGLDNISKNIIPKAMDKIEISQERNLSSFKSEIQICQDLACHQHDTEKIRNNMQIN